MALVTRSSNASIDVSNAQVASQISGDLLAGEALDPAAPCYIKASDGLVYMTDGTAATEPARTHGFTGKAYAVGQAVTLFGAGTRFGYDRAGGLTPGQPLYAGATAGRLDSAATTGGSVALAFAVSAYDIMVATLKLT